MLQSLLRDVEDHLISRSLTLRDAVRGDLYLAAKLVDWRQDRYTIFDVEDRPGSQSFLLKARNNFESYSNYAEKKVKETAYWEPRPSALAMLIHRDYAELGREERQMVWYGFVKRANIDIIDMDIGIGLSELLGVEKLQGEDAEYSKTVNLAPLDVVAMKRCYQNNSNGEKLPWTGECLAINGELLWLSVYDYSLAQIKTAGNILTMPLIRSVVVTRTGKKKRAGLSLDEYKQKFPLLDWLEKTGFDLIRKHKSQVSIDLILPNTLSDLYPL